MAKGGVTLNKSQINRLSRSIETFAEDVVVPRYFQAVQSVMFSAQDVGRTYMNERVNWTPTGIARRDRGGNGPGRVDTGTMRDSFKYDRGRKVGTRRYEHTIGWLEGTPVYAFFQEYGTRNGVQAMGALAYTQEYIRKELKARGLKV